MKSCEMAVNAVERAQIVWRPRMWNSPRWTPPGPIRAYLYDVIEATIEAGATTINIPDTVGYAVPERIRAI